MVGRGTRISPGKLDCIVLDVVDSTIGNSLVTLPTLMGLSNILDLKGRRLDEVVTELELVQLEHPSIDLTTLKDIDELQTIVSTIDMFEVRFPAEVEANSDLIWFKACDGGYRINVPKDGPECAGFMKIYQNPLGQWAIEGRIKDAELAGTRASIEEAFKVGDEQIRKRLGQMRLSYLLREATWHNKKVTDGQKRMLVRLFPKRIFPFDQMTAGMASKIIAERLGRKG
jgi:ATP-dependent helicase IRC3